MLKKFILNTAVLFCIPFLFTACSGNKQQINTPPLEISFDKATASDVEKTLNKKADSKENNKESGISADNYEDYNFAGYDGKISFYYKDKELLYYKWIFTEQDKDKAKEVYSDVCNNLENSYGKGTENNNASSNLFTTTYDTDEQQVVAQKISNGNGFEISFMVVGK